MSVSHHENEKSPEHVQTSSFSWDVVLSDPSRPYWQVTDSSSAAGADDFDLMATNPTSQRVTVVTVTVTGAT